MTYEQPTLPGLDVPEGKKPRKTAELSWIDPDVLLALARVAGKGAEQYGHPYNYRAGFEWSKAYNALVRHLLAFWGGEDTDPESGEPHLAHALWNTHVLLSFSLGDYGKDDRPGSLPKQPKWHSTEAPKVLWPPAPRPQGSNASLSSPPNPEQCVRGVRDPDVYVGGGIRDGCGMNWGDRVRSNVDPALGEGVLLGWTGGDTPGLRKTRVDVRWFGGGGITSIVTSCTPGSLEPAW